MGHIDFDTIGDADILEFLVVLEFTDSHRAYQHGLDALFLDNGLHVRILGIYLDTQQFHVLDAVLVADEAHNLKAARGLRAHRLGHGHATGNGAVNEGALGLGILVNAVEYQLDQHAHNPHDKRGQRKGDNQVQIGECRQGPDMEVTEKPAAAQGNGQGNRVGIHQLKKVYKAGIPENAGIGFKDTDADPADNGIEERRVQKGGTALEGDIRIVGYPEGKAAGGEYNDGIGQQYDPIRQYVPAKIPGRKFFKYVHTLS